jgi:multiple sugar transport system permease protein
MGMAVPIAAGVPEKTKRGFFRQDLLAPYVFISPFYILFTIFFLVPTVFALVISLYRWRALSEAEFFALRNFERLYGDEIFWLSVQNTAFYSVASLFVVVPLALLEALALNSKKLYFRTFWRAVYFVPIVTSTVAVAMVFQLLYNREFGLINAVIGYFNIAPIDWLGNRDVAKYAVMGVVLWRWTGLLAVYFLAGLQSISQELLEAAEIDGANTLQRFLYITLPLLRPVVVFVMLIVLIGAMQIFDDPRIMTDGGPANATLSVVQYLYTRGIERLEYGYASAVGVFLFVVIFVLSLIQFRALRGFSED